VFDIGFSELFVIGVVALVVIGPERLPKVARTAGHLFGRLQRYVSQVKSDISREMDAAELSKVKTEFESAARSFKADVESRASDVEREMREAQQSIERELEAKSESAEPTPPSPQMELGIEAPDAPPAPAPASTPPKAG
jgi:sec-independent protein translocase protein TatB